ncbi:alpha/beta hydrolase family protein [Streptomyces sp. RS10V-4]|uniref:alpha/beta hydrolase n=1 Tax=Streptomyces rhizoryzae TaxID=2932493 RepID=UPI002003645A|nr:alpha/beta hydrolase [Streptomyces rhizoryzae]MCK7626720.1 alpha/beta hydrolase family protein [Streptomyces rhizoryzae]
MTVLRSAVRRSKRALTAAALALAVAAGTGGWAAGSAQTAVTGPAPGAAAWRADHSLGLSLPDPASASPAEVARFFAALTGAQRQALAARHPLTVGNLDGAPVALRYQANARALRAERDRALARSTDPAGTRQDHQQARRAAARYASLLAPGRQILAFDPRGRGQVAEVHGDLAAARRTAVVVPGSDIDLATFDRTTDPYGTPTGMARSLRRQMAAEAPGVPTAVIAWVGYTTPVGLGPDAATGRLAEAGAPRLTRFLAGLAATGTPAPAVLCHSYGSVVCGLAAPRTGRGDLTDLIVFGSPGMRRDTAADLRTPARVWAARDASDWIGDVPNVEVLGLGHGTDPTDPAFGARRVPAVRAEGHTGYLAPGTDSLRDFAAIALGRPADVR